MPEVGTFRCYTPKKFGADRMAILSQANAIMTEYEKAGYVLTLRQLYYQFVSRDLFANRVENYNKLGEIVSDGRLAGLLSWTAIEDRTRNLQGLSANDSPAQAIKHARDAYRLDLWADQPMRPIIRIEKDALLGVIAPICQELRIDYIACRGYSSQSELWRAGNMMADYYRRGQRPIVFYLGDHDPSGIDMTRDNEDRLSLFAGVQVMVVRLGLNMDQVRRYNPPPNPTKMSDSRAGDYIDKFGDESWELDALDPKVTAALIRDAVAKVRDEGRWSDALAQEAADINEMDMMIEQLNGGA